MKLRLFLFAFFLYFLFSYWIGVPEYSRLLLTISIINDESLEIPLLYDPIADLFFYEGKVYTDKQPGISLLYAWGFYLPVKFLLPEEKIYFVSISPWDEKAVLNVSERMLLLVATSLNITLSALSVLLFYKVSKEMFKFRTAIFLTVFFAFGSLFFVYAPTFNEFSLSAFFSLLFLKLFLKIEKRNKKISEIYLLYFLLGFSILFSLTLIPLMLTFIYYLFFKRKYKKGLMFFFIGLVPVIIFNYLTSGNIGKFPPMNFVPFKESVKSVGLNRFVILMFKNLFYPFKGIFFYYPIFMFSLFLLLRTKKKISRFLFFNLMFSTLLFSLPVFSYTGSYFSSKEFVCIVPYFILPLGFALEKKNKTYKLLALILMLYSFAVSISGFQYRRDFAQEISVENYEKYTNNLFEMGPNPLFDWYIPQLAKSGPRIKILECIKQMKIPDIRINFGC